LNEVFVGGVCFVIDWTFTAACCFTSEVEVVVMTGAGVRNNWRLAKLLAQGSQRLIRTSAVARLAVPTVQAPEKSAV
jgi:hypothetical protein